MLTKLLMRVVVIAVDGRLFEGAVHPFHLTIRPWVIGFGQPMFNLVFSTDAVKQQREGLAVSRAIGELDAIVSQDRMDFVGRSRKFRTFLRRRGIRFTIPHKRNEQRTGPFNRAIYRLRYRIECFINRLKQFRRIATRYEKRAENYLAMVTLAAIFEWL